MAMIGLICIGLLGLGTVIFISRSNQAQQAAAIPDTPSPIPPTFTPTSTPSATPTETPPPTPTATPVISQENEAEATPLPVETATTEPGATPTNTLVLPLPVGTDTPTPTPAPAAQIPASGGVLVGNNGILMWAGIVLLILLTFGVINHLKSSPPKV